VKAVDVIVAQSRHVTLRDETQHFRVHRLEDLGIFDADRRQFVDVEEAAVVDLVGRDAPVTDAVRLIGEQRFEPGKTFRVAGRSVDVAQRFVDRLPQFRGGGDQSLGWL
jgi:hypothetical protein